MTRVVGDAVDQQDLTAIAARRSVRGEESFYPALVKSLVSRLCHRGSFFPEVAQGLCREQRELMLEKDSME